MTHISNDLSELVTELQELVAAGLLIEVRREDEPARYAIRRGANPGALPRDGTPAARDAGVEIAGSEHDFELPDWPEPCPNCGARTGFDGGARCLSCSVPWPPEM